MMKRTKIVATLGPASESKDVITQLVQAGVNVFRLNFSHGTYENHAMLISRVREVAEELAVPIAILQDLQGPKIRVGLVPDEGIVLTQGTTVVFDTSLDTFTDNAIPIDYHELDTFLKPGERLFLNDGKSEVHIVSVEGTRITADVVVGGTILSHKGINVPDSTLDVRVLTDKDKKDAKFGVEMGVDLMALSFVMKPEDIIDLRHHLKACEQELVLEVTEPIRIIAKIERQEAVDGIEGILDVVDGIMVARGDLGIEIPAQEVPLVQKRLIDAAMAHAKPVIVATQMLDSMQHNPRPTRAEVSDVANAVIDHTDAVMLSNETAMGEYPVVVVETMRDIIVETEASHYDDLPMRDYKTGKENIDVTITQLSRVMSEDIHAKVILVASLSGGTGRLISRHRPELPVAVATSSERVCRQLALSWGVLPFMLPTCRSIEELVERSIVALKRKNIVSSQDNIVVVAGEPVGHAGHVNLLEVRVVE